MKPPHDMGGNPSHPIIPDKPDDKKFEEVMSNTDVNKFSKPFKSTFGWHILKVLDRREKN